MVAELGVLVFDIMGRLAVDHKCDRQTDRRLVFSTRFEKKFPECDNIFFGKISVSIRYPRDSISLSSVSIQSVLLFFFHVYLLSVMMNKDV